MKNTTTISTSAALPSLFTLHPSTTGAAAVWPAGLLVFPTYLTTLLLLLASFALYLLQSRSDLQGKKPKTRHGGLPPGPKPWPVVGNLPQLFMKKPTFRWILCFMKEMDTRIACVRVGSVHIIPVTCPELAREFLKKHDAIFADRPLTMGTHYSSRGFLSIAVAPWGDQWKKMRRVVASEVINPSRLRWLLEKRTEEADNLVRYVYSQCKSTTGAVVDVRVAARHYSANVIRKMMFGRRHFGEGRPDGGPGLEEQEHVEALFTVLSLLYAFNISDYVPALRCLDLDGHERTMKQAIKIVNKYQEPIVDQRIEEWRSGLRKDPEDLLDVIVSINDDQGRPLLTAEEIKAQTADLIYASVDNPSNAIEWAMAEMLNQPEVIRKAVEELDRVVGQQRLVQESDVPQLNYVKACAREAFRLHPIAPFNLPHVAMADTTVAGYTIPKGSHVLLSRLGLGRNPAVWPEPHRFDPERHIRECTPGGAVDILEPDLRFITFSTGRRGCMGAALGSAMTVMLLARLLQGFTWSVPHGKTCIELRESAHDLFLAEPLLAHAEPRLPPHLYPVH
ncbi:hypothetical protein Taro_017753 [Colocasia esculenta]|uniref:Cytochrome P450 n=1 Tax=Colocasia esculenta TaxID=4460 RepID=A0A843UPI6_COLES|nr:hypothetical protein [Colocasia esculenta]